MNANEIILVGGGGHCKSCIDVIESQGRYIIKGILDLPENKLNSVSGYPVIGNDNDIPELAQKFLNFLITIGNTGRAVRRNEIFDIIIKNGGNLPVIISPLTYVSKSATINTGSILLHNSLVNADAKIGFNCIINSKALIEHDTIVGDNCHISTGAIVNGGCQIGDNCFVGSLAVINQGVTIAPNTIIGAGSVVINNIDEPGVYVGVPAKKIKP